MSELSRLKSTLGNVGLSPSTRDAIQRRIDELESAPDAPPVTTSQPRAAARGVTKFLGFQEPEPKPVVKPSADPKPVEPEPGTRSVLSAKAKAVTSLVGKPAEDVQKVTPSTPPVEREVDPRISSAARLPSRFIKGSYKPPETSYEFLVKYAEPGPSAHLVSTVRGLQTTSYLPEKSEKVFQRSAVKAYESLTPQEKETYGYRYTEWEKIPSYERKYYPGSKAYFASLSSAEKQELVDIHVLSSTFKTYAASTTGRQEISAVGKSTHEKELKEKYGPLAISSISVYDTAKSEREIAYGQLFTMDYDVFPTLGIRTRAKRSFAEAAASTIIWPITLTQTGTKYITGEGKPTQILTRISTGKTFFPDVQKEYIAPYQIGATPGLIRTVVGEGIGVITKESPGLWEQYKADPVGATFATAGEISGLMIGSKGVHVAKVSLVRGGGYFSKGVTRVTGVKLPSYAQITQYTPKSLLRTAYWRGKERLGSAKYVPEEQFWHSGVLSGKAKFATARSPSEMLRQFKSTKTLDYSGGDILGVHATPSKIGGLTWIKKGTSETPGLSVSAYGKGSPHFLRIDKPYLGYGTSGVSLFPKLHMPTAPVFHLKDVFRLPKVVSTSYTKASTYLASLKRGPYAHIAPKAEMGGPEIEAIITKGTWASRISTKYFTTYEGHIVPIPHYKIFGEVPKSLSKTITGGIVSKTKDFLGVSYSAGAPSISIISPGSIASYVDKHVSDMKSLSSKPSKMSLPIGSSIVSAPSKSSIVSSAESFISSITKSSGSSITSSPSSSLISSAISFVSSMSSPSIPSSPSSPSSPSTPSIPSVPSYPSKPSYSSYSPPPPPSYYPPPPYLPGTQQAYPDVSKSGFNVMVKDRVYVKGKKVYKEKFIKLNKKPLSKRDALALGGHLVDNSAAATFKVTPAFGQAEELRYNVGYWGGQSHKFYTKDDRLIERTTFRIDSKGEREQITAKGLLARMKRIPRTPQVKPISTRTRGVSRQKVPSKRTKVSGDPYKAMQNDISNVMKAFKKLRF